MTAPIIHQSQAGAFRQGRVLELDGLRGMAIFSVFLYHYIAISGPSGEPTSTLQRLFLMGWAGVDLFFLLSGFLIGGILLDAREAPRYFSTFYARRFYRIIPIYYLWIAVFFFVLLELSRGLTGPMGGNPEHISTAGIYFVFVQNMVKIPHANLGTDWLGHLWSLAVEEQFYLLMPLAVRFLPRRRLVPLLFLAIAGAPVARVLAHFYLPQHAAAPYVLTPCRADALAMGVLLAIGWRSETCRALFVRYRAWVYAAGAVLFLPVAYLAVWKPSQYSMTMATWGFSAVDSFCALLLAVALMVPSGAWAWVCRWRFLSEIGRISYCLYIIHAAVNLGCHAVLLGMVPAFASMKSMLVTMLAFCLSFGIGKLSWRYFERPLLERGHAYHYFPKIPTRVTAEAVPRAAEAGASGIKAS